MQGQTPGIQGGQVSGGGLLQKSDSPKINLSSGYKSIHFIGVGGAGMSPIALLCKKRGFVVSGSDLVPSADIDFLVAEGITIFEGHKAKNVNGVDLVVISTAIPVDNPELVEAYESNIKVVSRAVMLGALMSNHLGISIGGTHGKTSSTSICAAMLEKLHLDPTVVVGGRPAGWKSNLRCGESEYFLLEADESDGSFLEFPGKIVMVTNIDDDHLDFYKTTDNLLSYFIRFINNVGSLGMAVLCIDCENVKAILPQIVVPYITYGLSLEADFIISNVKISGFKTSYSLSLPSGKQIDELTIAAPGVHYALNSGGCCAVVTQLANGQNIDYCDIVAAFSGVARRFEIVGEVENVKVIDDYAHHPTEISAVLSALRESLESEGESRLVVVFQPHRAGRTKRLAIRLGEALAVADKVYILPVYYPPGTKKQSNPESISKSAGESVFISPSPAEVIYKAVINYRVSESTDNSSADGCVLFPHNCTLSDCAKNIASQCQSGDCILTIGAGSVTKLGLQICAFLKD